MEEISLSPYFPKYFCIFMSVAGYLCFLTLKKTLSVGEILSIPADHSLCIQALCSEGFPPKRAVWVSLLWADNMDSLIGLVGSLAQLVAKPCPVPHAASL